jgi:trehalose 6-phosphate phosphatase
MKHLFQDWQMIRGQRHEFPSLYFFLDYDGTLTPIVLRPELARLSPEARKVLIRLRDCPQVLIAVISGRAVEDLYRMIGIPGITYVGNHGLEIRNPAGIHKKMLSTGRRKEMNQIQATLKANLGSLPGVLLEDKESILSVHYRLVARENQVKVFREMEEVMKKWGKGWMVSRGKMVCEIRPRADFHKGKAVRELLKNASPFPLLPFYFGDDRTDEDAFRFLKGRGITVFVGPPDSPSEAEYFLQDPDEVLEFLRRVAKMRPLRKSPAEETEAKR